MLDAASIARLFGGQVAGANTVLVPGPGHSSTRDRSLAIRLEPKAPDGFLTYSHAGDDWRACRDHVRQRLGLPAGQSGDGQRRAIPAHHIEKWDLASNEADAAQIPRPWTPDEQARISGAQHIWNSGQDPRGTPAEIISDPALAEIYFGGAI